MVPINPNRKPPSSSHSLYLFYNTSPARQHDRLLFPAMKDKRRGSLIWFNCPAAQDCSWNSHFSSPSHYKYSALKMKLLFFLYKTNWLQTFGYFGSWSERIQSARFMLQNQVIFLHSEREKDLTATKPKLPQHQVIHHQGLFKSTGGHVFKLHLSQAKCIKGTLISERKITTPAIVYSVKAPLPLWHTVLQCHSVNLVNERRPYFQSIDRGVTVQNVNASAR